MMIDAAGVTVAGGFWNSINLGGTTLTSNAYTDIFLVRYDPAGTRDPAGNLFLVGTFDNTTNLGGKNISSNRSPASLFAVGDPVTNYPCLLLPPNFLALSRSLSRTDQLAPPMHLCVCWPLPEEEGHRQNGTTDTRVKPGDLGEPETALGRLAESLQPGEMKKLKTIGYNWDLLKSWYEWDHDADGTKLYGAQKMYNIMTSWANDGKWDPKTEQILFLGGGHYAAFKFVTYSAKTNKWTLEPVPPWLDPRSSSQDCGSWPKSEAGNKSWPRGHTYDCNAIYPEKRLYALTLWDKLRLYDIDKKKWRKSIPGFRTNSGGPSEGFPELGGFVAMNKAGKLCLYDIDEGKQKELGGVPFSIHGVMEYNPVHKVLIVGGGDSNKTGNRSLSLVDAKGKIKQLKNLPVHVNCTPTAKVMCDPVSGEYIFQEVRASGMEQKQKVYALHPLLDQWKEIKGRSFPSGVAIAVDTYGVIVICTDHEVFVYKHKPMWP
jgi:hypothetical protein